MDQFTHRPKVSICMPSYNHERFIGEAIESVISQSYTDWELIVSDDASPDDTLTVVREYQRKYPGKIKLLTAAKNVGPSVNGNKAIDAAQGEYLAYLCSDDRMLPERLATQVAYLDRYPDIAMVFSEVGMIDSAGQQSDIYNVFSKNIDDLWLQLLEGNFLNAPSVMLRRTVYEDVGIHNPGLLYVQDYDYWLRTLDKYKIARLPQKLTEYRTHENNLSVKAVDDAPYAGYYETVFVILRAIKRRDQQLSAVPCTKDQIIEKKLQLAEIAKRSEQSYLSSFKYSVEIYYLLALDVLELDPENAAAKNMLREVYAVVGDTRRANGGKTLTRREYHEQGGMLQRALNAHELVRGSLIKLVRMIVDDRETGLKDERAKDKLFCETAKLVLAEIKSYEEQHGDISLKNKYADVSEVILLLRERLQLNAELDEARALLTLFWEMEETYLYRKWIEMHELKEIDGEIFAERMMLKWRTQPIFHLILFLLPGEENLLADTVDSLAQQMYQHWCFTVISGDPAPDEIFSQFDHLQWRQVEVKENPYIVLNERIQESASDWVAVIEPGARFEWHTLIRFGDYINLKPDSYFFYADEDNIDHLSRRKKPKFKPDFNLDLLRSDFYFGGFCVINKSALLDLGGFQATLSLENYDLAFKIYEQFGEQAFCHISDVLYHAPESSGRSPDSELKRIVVENHLIRSQIAADVTEGYVPGTHHIAYFYEKTPKVSVIIPTRDKLAFFRPCLCSLMEKTDYPDFEILVVNNQSEDPDILQYFDELPSLYPGRVTVLEYDKEFNFSAISNLASRHATGEYLLFLNNDTEVIQGQWMQRMMAFGQRADVGIVGARLSLPEKPILQHMGVVIGMTEVADHPYAGILDLQMPGYMGRALLDQNFSAVTGGCLLIRKSIYQQVEGMDEDAFPILFNDTDLCLKVRQSGYRVVWTPTATLVHHLSASLNSQTDPSLINKWKVANLRSYELFFSKWRDVIANDPAYNRHLSLMLKDFKVEASLPCNWDVNFHDRPRILAMPLAGGAGDYRVIMPLDALSDAGIAQCEYVRLEGNLSRSISVAEAERLAPDTLVVQSAINDIELHYLKELRKLKKDLFIVFSLDDLITEIPEKSTAYSNFMRNYRDAKIRLRKALSYCDRLVVSTEPLAELCAEMIDDIRIVPNRLNRKPWSDLKSHRGQGDKPRVGWAGAQQHQGDLEIIVDVVKETAGEIDWIFMGMCPEEIRSYVKEYRAYVPFEEYPDRLADMNLDLAIAPLEACQFNDAKSNLRLLEYGALGWPVICSDALPYRSYDAPVIRVANDKSAWLAAIKNSLSDMEANYRAGDHLQKWVHEYFMLEDHLNEWQQAFLSDA